MSIYIEVDTVLDAAYIQLTDSEVARTVQVDDHIQIDLDEFGVAVGIEVLDEGTKLPFTRLVADFHVRSEVVDLLRLIRPDVRSFLSFTQGSDGVSDVARAGVLWSDTAVGRTSVHS